MDSLTRIRAKINDFPGYDSEDNLVRSDRLVRAYAGERLSELEDRLGGAVAEAVGPLILRTSFANQERIKPFERPQLTFDLAALSEADAALLDLADQAAAVPEDGVTAFIDTLTKAFDARDTLMAAEAPPAP